MMIVRGTGPAPKRMEVLPVELLAGAAVVL
jgi:hypothetical protein